MQNYSFSSQSPNHGKHFTFSPQKSNCPKCGKVKFHIITHVDGKENLHSGGRCFSKSCEVFIPPSRTSAGSSNIYSDYYKALSFAQNTNGNSQNERRPSHYAFVEKYIYSDEEDRPLYEVHRKEGRNRDGSEFTDEHGYKKKEFRQYKAGSYDPIGDTRRVLYRMKNVLKAVEDSVPVYLVEGEKDVHTLERIGLVATTVAGGANAPWLREFSEMLRNAEIVILPDNDAAGNSFAEKVAFELHSVASAVKVVKLEGLPPKGDVTDFFDNGGTIEALKQAVDDCQPCQDRLEIHTGIHGDLEITTWEDTGKLTATTEWIWPHFLPKGYVTMCVSSPGTGKSNLILWLAGLFTNGNAFPDGSCVDVTSKVLWIETEFGQAMHMERSAAFGIKLSDILNPLENPLDTVSLENAEHRQRIRAIAMREDVGAIIVDSLSGAHSLQENNTEVKAILQFLAELARDTGKCVIVTHHLNKSIAFGEKPNINNVRGSSVITQFCRVIWALDVPGGEGAERKRLTVIKTNLGIMPESIGFEIKEDCIIFTETPESLKPKQAIDIAFAWLSAFLKDGERLQKDIEEAALENGISSRTLQRAKKSLFVKSRKEYDHFTKKSSWYWSLPNEERHEDTVPLHDDDGDVGTLEYGSEHNYYPITTDELNAAFGEERFTAKINLLRTLQVNRNILGYEAMKIVQNAITDSLLHDTCNDTYERLDW